MAIFTLRSSPPTLSLRARNIFAVLALAAALAPCFASTAEASTRPKISAFHSNDSYMDSRGGHVTLKARVSGARSCKLTSNNRLVPTHSVSCRRGRVAAKIKIPANELTRSVTYAFHLTATGAGGRTRSKAVKIRLTGRPVGAKVVGLDKCAPGPDCFYGPIDDTYNNYGNYAPNGLGSCTFAAAANWEQIVLGASPDPQIITYEFGLAGGTTTGLPQDKLWSFWKQHGIGGYRLNGITRFRTDPINVKNGVRAYGAMIVQLQFTGDDYFAQYKPAAMYHDVVVDGFTPEGPLVVSWGMTLQMTWQQWQAEVVDMWGISASK